MNYYDAYALIAEVLELRPAEIVAERQAEQALLLYREIGTIPLDERTKVLVDKTLDIPLAIEKVKDLIRLQTDVPYTIKNITYAKTNNGFVHITLTENA